MGEIGLVVEGGGMRGIYGSGVLDYFLDHAMRFSYCIASSAGSANVASFLAEQTMRNYRFYTQHMQDKRYMGFRNLLRTGSFFGLEFIYETLTNEIDPIDYDVFLQTKSRFCVAATDALSGKASYFDNSAFQRNNCRVLMASSAMPVICKPVEIHGHPYYDGGLADPISVQRALEDGCETLVIVLSRPRGYVKPPESFKKLYSRLLRKYPNTVKALDRRHKVYNETLDLIAQLEKEGRATVIAPSQKIDIGFASKSVTELDRLYHLGRQDASACRILM